MENPQADTIEHLETVSAQQDKSNINDTAPEFDQKTGKESKLKIIDDDSSEN